jgi:hypothetical protein
MADAYANSIMVDALIHSREGTIDTTDTSHYEPGFPGIDEPKQLERWEPWVRAYIAIGELLQGITFATSGNGFQVLSSGNLIAEVQRPASATFESQIPLVLNWAQLREERATEIMAQIDAQYAFWSSIVYLHPDRTRRTMELINMVLQFCVYVEMRFKHALACYRPVEYNAEVQPMITTPGHNSFPMGHGTQAYAVAHVLKMLLSLDLMTNTSASDQLDRLSARITTNRVVAGVHFPVDSMAGRMLGVALGEYFYGRCTGDQTFMSRKFLAAGINGANATTDFNPFNTTIAPAQDLGAGPFYSATVGVSVPQSSLMKHLWRRARKEWAGRFGVPV